MEYHCPECGEDIPGKVNARLHWKVLHTDRDVSYDVGECEWCGDEYYAQKGSTDDRVYCSPECRDDADKHERGTIRGPGYSDDWTQLKKEVLERDGYACVDCGCAVGRHGGNPDVHHIVPSRSVQLPELADDADNLITLCPSCHGEWEGASFHEQLEKLRGVASEEAEKRIARLRGIQLMRPSA